MTSLEFYMRGKAHHNEPESDGRSEPTSDPTSTRAGSLWPSGGTSGRLWAPFGSLWGTLGLPLAVLWGPFGHCGAQGAGPWVSEEKPKKTVVFCWFFYTAVSPRMDGGFSADGGGKDVSGPVEDLLNENPSHVALGKLNENPHSCKDYTDLHLSSAAGSCPSDTNILGCRGVGGQCPHPCHSSVKTQPNHRHLLLKSCRCQALYPWHICLAYVGG